MYEIMSADEAIRLIRDGDCIRVNSFVGIENPWNSMKPSIGDISACSRQAI